MSALAPTVEAFFTQRLLIQRDASPRTIAAYRDALRLLFAYVHGRTGKPPSQLDFADLDATVVAAFLTHLEAERGNSVPTRNARLSAIRSLFGYAALRHPEHAELIQRVLAIPAKRHEQTVVCFLAPDEIDALLAAPDRATWTGRRDHALLLVDIQTGLRLSELTGLVCGDVHLSVGAHVRCHGKGRKDRATPPDRPDRDRAARLADRTRRRARRPAVPHPPRPRRIPGASARHGQRTGRWVPSSSGTCGAGC